VAGSICSTTPHSEESYYAILERWKLVAATSASHCCACHDKFVLKAPAQCSFIAQGTVTYKHMVKVPRRSGAAGAQRDEVAETTVPRAEFMRIFPSQLSMWLLHMYVADWQDAVAEQLMSTPREGHAVIGQDFGMNYTCHAWPKREKNYRTVFEQFAISPWNAPF
jgi:hypothetical protein